MKTLFGLTVAAGLVASTMSATAQDGRNDGENGGSPGVYGGYGTPAYRLPTGFPPPVYFGWGSGWGHPGYNGGFGYRYSYYTHAPGYSFTEYRKSVPRYYPGQYGGFGHYGYYPW